MNIGDHWWCRHLHLCAFPANGMETVVPLSTNCFTLGLPEAVLESIQGLPSYKNLAVYWTHWCVSVMLSYYVCVSDVVLTYHRYGVCMTHCCVSSMWPSKWIRISWCHLEAPLIHVQFAISVTLAQSTTVISQNKSWTKSAKVLGFLLAGIHNWMSYIARFICCCTLLAMASHNIGWGQQLHYGLSLISICSSGISIHVLNILLT